MVLRASKNSHHVSINEMKCNVICFTVPNGILITRLNGKIAIHGNSKHASHLVRLMVQAQNILTECTYNPVLSGDDLDLVLSVLGGDWEYDYLIEWAEVNDARIKAMNTNLPKKPQHKRIEKLLMSLNEISLLGNR